MLDAELGALPATTPRKLELLPGLMYRNAFGRSGLWIMPLLLLPLLLMVPLLQFANEPRLKLELGHAQVAVGRVASVAERDLRNCREGQRLVYAFTAPSGAEYRGSADLCDQSSSYGRKAGDTLPVRYLVSDPAINDLGDNPRQIGSALIPMLFIPLMMVVLLVGFILPQARPLRQARKMFRQGRLGRATVLFVKKRSPGAANNMAALSPSEVFLTYDGPAGRQEAKAFCGNDWLLQQLIPGGVVHIAYLPEKPEEVALLEAYFR